MRPFLCAMLVFLGTAAYAAAPAPTKVRIGAYVMRLNDLSPTNGSFATDLWVWTLSDPNVKLHPIQTLRLQDVKSVTADTPGEAVQNGWLWGYREFAAVVIEDWDTRYFPFDHHTLAIRIAETLSPANVLVYTPDGANSTIDPRVHVSGWRITGSHLETREIRYPTQFGDPDPQSQNSRWSEAWLMIDIRRNGFGIFAKIILVAYIAFALVLLSFLMDAAVFSSRISMLVGCLFATVVNMRASESVIGRTDSFTLVDQIHLLVAFFVFVSAVAALVTRKKDAAVAQRIDRWTAIISLTLFAGANAVLIGRALVG